MFSYESSLIMQCGIKMNHNWFLMLCVDIETLLNDLCHTTKKSKGLHKGDAKSLNFWILTYFNYVFNSFFAALRKKNRRCEKKLCFLKKKSSTNFGYKKEKTNISEMIWIPFFCCFMKFLFFIIFFLLSFISLRRASHFFSLSKYRF